MTTTTDLPGGLVALARHLRAARQSILSRWHAIATNDGELTTGDNLSRSQFNDHIPEVLDAFEHELRALAASHARKTSEVHQSEQEQRDSAAGHGLHRWQQGYRLRELMREWGHLQLCLVDDLEMFAKENTELHPEVMPTARRALARLCSEGVCESAGQYTRMQRMEASSRERDLERALEQLEEMGRQRAEAWREAAHDLRGNLGVVKNATSVLSLDGVPETMRTEAFTLLQRGVGTLHQLLNDLMILARLEAGHDRRKVAPFDAARLFADLCENLRPLAVERELYLVGSGPGTLPVEGDAVKVQRIAHNLTLNAVKYTEHGGVRLTWGPLEDETDRWTLCVQDTGPGFDLDSVTPFARAIKEATEESHAAQQEATAVDPTVVPTEPAPTLPSESSSRPRQQPPGEGIGLSIVKRLCELLDARLELETTPGKGTTFRVIFPRSYVAEMPTR
jgi:signal transduction histidine kinase